MIWMFCEIHETDTSLEKKNFYFSCCHLEWRKLQQFALWERKKLIIDLKFFYFLNWATIWKTSVNSLDIKQLEVGH